MAETTPSAEINQEEIDSKIAEVEYAGRKMGPTLGLIVGIVAATWSLFQLWIASPLPFIFDIGIIVDVPARGIHLAFGLLLAFLLFPFSRRLIERRISVLDIALALIGCFAALWVFIDQEGITGRLGSLLTIEILGVAVPFEALVGGAGILLLMEATRRAIGLPLVVVAGVFLLYSIFGQSMPELISHRGLSVTRLIGYHWLGGEAIFGIPVSVSVDFVFLFVLLGALLDRAGAGRYFLDLAFAMVGKYRGGPAKAAILASGMTGLISGSSIANVVTTGVFTIPVMRRSGYSAVKAGAIEVAASTNGQIMPPIMGAAAFIMAELIGISYYEVIVAAFIPAVASYMGLLYISHLEAMKLGLKGMAREEIPRFVSTFLAGAHFLMPIALLVYLLMGERWTAASAVFYTIMVMLLIMIATRVSPPRLKRGVAVALYLVPIAVAVILRGPADLDPQSALFWSLAVAAAIIVVLAAIRQSRDGDLGGALSRSVREIVGGLIAGARNMIGIAVAVATAGIIVGAVSSTGLNNAMVGLVEALSGGNIYILLVLTAVLSLILGMGLPTTANYLVVASLLAGVLVELGTASGLVLPLIAVHLFVFYFGILADDTPPVCLAAFAAAAISRADPLKTGVQGFIYDIRTAILPFVFIFNPELLLIGVTSFWHGLTVFVVAIAAIFCFASATQGWLVTKTKAHEIVLLLVVTLALFRPDFIMNQIHPEFAAVDLAAFAAGAAPIEPGREFRIHVTRETDYGDRFKLYRVTAPATPGTPPYGLELERAEDGRYAVADLAFNGLAEKAGLQFGDYVIEVDVEQLGRPARQWVYPFAFALLGIIIVLQLARRRRANATAGS